MDKKVLPIACPLCGRKHDFPVNKLLEGFKLSCPFCRLELTLHGHMWEHIREEIAKLEKTG